MTKSLRSLSTGQKAYIDAISVSPEFAHRLSALGLRVGQLVEVIRRAPFAGPLQLRIGTTDVIMRRQDAASILVTAA
jgi:ferrous iron transport protein A